MNATDTRFERTLFATVGGRIWWPQDLFTKDIQLSEREFNYSDDSRPTLREMVLRATNDGDFQSCDLISAAVRIRHARKDRTVEKWVELTPESFTIKDCWAREEILAEVA